MPQSALQHVALDYCVPAREIAPLLRSLVGGEQNGVPSLFTRRD